MIVKREKNLKIILAIVVNLIFSIFFVVTIINTYAL